MLATGSRRGIVVWLILCRLAYLEWLIYVQACLPLLAGMGAFPYNLLKAGLHKVHRANNGAWKNNHLILFSDEPDR